MLLLFSLNGIIRVSKFRQKNALNATGMPQTEKSEEVRQRQLEARRRGAETQRKRSREALLKGGHEVFTKRGWKKTKMEDIASASGVSLATAYGHFGSKGLLAAHVYAPLLATLDTHARTALEHEAPRKVLGTHVGELATLICTNRPLTRAVVTAMHEQDAQGELAKGESSIRELVAFDQPLRRIISAGQERGDFSTQHPADFLAKYHSEALIHMGLDSPEIAARDLAQRALSQMSF
jgi:AcrR family transcriptional regulator